MKPATYRAFETLAELVRQRKVELSPPTDKPQPPVLTLSEDLSDEELFQISMQDVLPLGWSNVPLPPSIPLEIQMV